MSAARPTSPRPIRSRPAHGDVWVSTAPSHPMSRRRLVAWIAILSIFLPSVSATGALVALYATTSLPEIPPLAETTVLLDRSGNEVAELHAGVDRVLIPFSQMPESLREAVVAVEDANFYRHGGIDRMALVRATWRNLTSGSLSQGGSTITQQYVKNVLTGSERSVSRKVREAILAVKLEDATSKDEILRGYLNTVYFGHGAYGVQAAARTYFARDAKDLTLLQSATLAGLISAPSARDPFEHPEEARLARDLALTRMTEVGSIGPARAALLRARPLRLAEEANVRSAAPHFMELVRTNLKASYGLDALYRGGLRVRTTLDTEWQRAAERAIRTSLPSRSDPEAALVAIDPRNGAIRAMVGGRSFARSEFNLATQARRQAGSAFKPFVLVAALERGISPLEVRAGPSSITIPDPFCETDGEPWSLSNAGDQSAGTMSIENATAGSVNTIFAQLTVEVGPEAVAEVARRMGIRSRLAPVCSIGLGTSEVTPLEMTSAYATLAARGSYVEPTAIDQVTGSGGEILQGPLRGLASVGSEVLSPQDADATTRVLRGVVDHGTGTAARLGDRPAAGKTGTAQDATDAWFCGYVPQLVTCVWVGYPDGARPMRNVAGVPEVYGGTIPAKIWHDFMTEATEGMPVMGFPAASYVVYADPPPPDPSPVAVPAAPSAAPSPSPSAEPSSSPSTDPSPSAKPSPSPSPSVEPEPSPSEEPAIPLGIRSADP